MNADSYWIRIEDIDINLADIITVTHTLVDRKGSCALVGLKNGDHIRIEVGDYEAFNKLWSKYMVVMTRRWIDTTPVDWEQAAAVGTQAQKKEVIDKSWQSGPWGDTDHNLIGD